MGELINMSDRLRGAPDQGGDGGGPEDPMVGMRVARLEDDMKEVRKDLASIKETLARIDGRVSSFPSAFQLYVAILVTWGAGAGIAFTLIKFAAP